MKRERKEPEPEGCALWVVTFGDAMSLLVSFFVMLVSFADFEEHALQDMMGALKGGLRAVPLPMATTVGRVETSEDEDGDQDVVFSDAAAPGVESSQESLQSQPENTIIRSNSPDYYLHLLNNGVSLVIRRGTVFTRGTAGLSDPTHEVWQIATDLMHSVSGEVRVEISLPENVMVRIPGYTTAWGLGIEQALAIQQLLSRSNGGDLSQISTSVCVLQHISYGAESDGTVEILFIGADLLKLEGMPRKILRGIWRETKETEERRDNGSES
jgi:chemotaxis protein MotB